MQKPNPTPVVLAILALVFAPFGALISWRMYSGDSVWTETPLLILATVVFVVEVTAAILTLREQQIGRRLFLAYGALALVLALADGAYLIFEPRAQDVGAGLFSAFGEFFHAMYTLGSLVWAVVVIALVAGTWSRRNHVPRL